MATTSIGVAAEGRNHGLDLVKWIALVAMVLDHLRLVWPELAITFISGRISFPFFCLAIAANVARGTPGQLITAKNCRYVALMAFFSAVSEVPYRYFYDSATLNVFPSLTLGVLVALGLYQRTLHGLLVAVVSLVIAAVFEETLMYGVFGIILPAAFTLAIKKADKPALAVIPAVLCVLLNSRHGALARALELDIYSIATLLTAFCSAYAGLWLLHRFPQKNVWPVRHWAYWFYPVHMLVLHAFDVYD